MLFRTPSVKTHTYSMHVCRLASRRARHLWVADNILTNEHLAIIAGYVRIILGHLLVFLCFTNLLMSTLRGVSNCHFNCRPIGNTSSTCRAPR